MKEILPEPPAVVRNHQIAVQQLFQKFVVPSYGRFDVVFSHGSGSWLWDVNGRRFLDLGGGIAVCSLGHAHQEITDALVQQSQKLVHVSNLYYHEPQGRLAERLVGHLAPGRVFFSNSGAEANEGLYKLARRFGHDEGRFEIITAMNSFHGRTLAGMAATGQDKIKKGFGPAVPGFCHVPFNDIDAVRAAISPATVAVLIEGVQGEGGITPARADYLLSLRALCDEKRLLLLMDGVQCGHFRTGRFQSFQRILEGVPEAGAFLPDGVSMAKSLGGGFPIGAFWVREQHAQMLGPGSHATTYGGMPLACAVASKVLDVIERDNLAENARTVGAWIQSELERIAARFPNAIRGVRGLGMMLGFELADKDEIPAFASQDKAPSLQMVTRLHETGVLTIPSGLNVVRLLPALNLRVDEARQGIQMIESVVERIVRA